MNEDKDFSYERSLFYCLNEMRQREISSIVFPYSEDIFGLIFSDQRQKGQVFGINEFICRIGREDGDAFFGSHHHEDAFGVVRTDENIRMVTGFVVEFQKIAVSERFPGGGRGHIKNGLVF
mgnify:CR=1 FL=1